MSDDQPTPEKPTGTTNGIWPTFNITDPAAPYPLPVPNEHVARAMEKANKLLAAGITPTFTIDGKPIGLDAPIGNDYAVGYSEPIHDTKPWSDPAHDVAGDLKDAKNGTGLYGPPAPRVPKAAWELPGHPVHDLAKQIFILDNAKLDRAAAAKDWETIDPAFRDYAFNIAQGLIRAGWEKKNMSRDAAVLEVVAAWSDPGPVPEFHRRAQRDLLKKWPVLGGALMRLAGLHWGPLPEPPPPVKA